MATTSSDVVNSSVVHSEPEAVTTLKEVAQETARRQLLVYWGAYTDGFAQGTDAMFMVDTGACDTMAIVWKNYEDCRPQLLELSHRVMIKQS